MAAIQPGVLHFKDLYQSDILDVTFEISGIDLTNKTLLCQVRESPESAVVLEFKESDNSLTKTVVSTTSTTVRFLKNSQDMALAPLNENVDGSPEKAYYFTIVMFTQATEVEDIQTIVKGTMEIIPQITRL